MKNSIRRVSITLTGIAIAGQLTLPLTTLAAAYPMVVQGDISITEVFVDQKLQSWLQNSGNLGGIGADGILTQEEREAVTELNLSGLGLTSLEGLDAFPNLRTLNVSHNNLTQLDLSGNPALERLYCSYNQLTELNLSSTPQLQHLNCSFNRLTALNLSGLSKLISLNCEMNYLASLDLTGCTELVSMYCRNNLLPTLDMSDNSKLEYIEASDNRLTTIDVSQMQALRFLHVSGNLLTKLDISHNTNLEGAGFMAQSNLLSTIVLPNQPGLTVLLENYEEQKPVEGRDRVEWFLDGGYSQKAPERLEAQGQTLHSQRVANRYTIYFSANGGNGSMAGASAQWDSDVQLPKNTLTRPGYTFTKWSTLPNEDATTYNDEETVRNLAGKNTDGDRITLYARWEANNYTIKLDPNGGQGEVKELESVYGQSAALPENTFTKDDKEFAGWATSAEGAVWYPNEAKVQNLTTEADGEVTLYAVWRTPISELQKPILAELDEKFRSYSETDAEGAVYTAQDWSTLAAAYAEAASAIEAADSEDVMRQALQTGIQNMDAVPTLEERVQEVTTAWQAEHSTALEYLSQKQLTESAAQQVSALVQSALGGLDEEQLKAHSTVSEPDDLKLVVGQAAAQLQTVASQLVTMQQAAQWLESLNGLSSREMSQVQEEDLNAYQTAISRYQSLDEAQKEYISPTVSQALTDRQELAGQKRSDALTLQEAYDRLDQEAYSAKGQAALKAALEEGLAAVRSAASTEQSSQARTNALEKISQVPTEEEEPDVSPEPPTGGDNGGSGSGSGGSGGGSGGSGAGGSGSGSGSGSGNGGGSGDTGGGDSEGDTDDDTNTPETPGNPSEDVTVTVTDEKTGASAQVTTTADGKVSAQVTVPQGVSSATIPIPCQGTTGTVAVMVLADGSRQVIPHSVYRDGTLFVRLSDSARVELVDASKDFSDVKSNAWFSDAVQFTSSRELFSGVGSGAFAPNRTMTRSMLVTVLHRLDGRPAPAGTGAFQDVSQDTWYGEAANWAAEQGITGGTGNGQFAPNQAITREAMALMLYRYAGSPELPETRAASVDRFQDAYQVSSWAREAMEWACATGLLTGDTQGTLRPQASSTRAEVATMLTRFVESITL